MLHVLKSEVFIRPLLNFLDPPLNLIDIETQIKALRFYWIPRILDSTWKGPWKSYFNSIIIWNLMEEPFYLIKDLTTSLNGFYSDLLLRWKEFRNTFRDINYVQSIIWNNKDIRIDTRSVFFKLYYENGIVYATWYLNPII